jgi:two-component system, chemotaxis family, chemotaxis protein CheY
MQRPISQSATINARTGDLALPRMDQGPMVSGVIFADNDAMVRGIVRSALVNAGQVVFLAHDGEEAVDLANSFASALVILDIHMPRVDGLSACTQIRAIPGYAEIPIVMLTADDRPEVRANAIDCGANRVFTKPFQMNRFLHGLSEFIRIPPASLQTPSEASEILRISGRVRNL